jgi:hypothetical protein
MCVCSCISSIFVFSEIARKEHAQSTLSSINPSFSAPSIASQLHRPNTTGAGCQVVVVFYSTHENVLLLCFITPHGVVYSLIGCQEPRTSSALEQVLIAVVKE